MRKICYSVAMSLDGYIAGPNGEADWIVMDPEIAGVNPGKNYTPSQFRRSTGTFRMNEVTETKGNKEAPSGIDRAPHEGTSHVTF